MGKVFERLRALEKEISKVRKTGIPTWFYAIETAEELSLIRQAKKEKHPIFAELSGKALINHDEEPFWEAIEDGIVDQIKEDTTMLTTFLTLAAQEFKITSENICKLCSKAADIKNP